MTVGGSPPMAPGFTPGVAESPAQALMLPMSSMSSTRPSGSLPDGSMPMSGSASRSTAPGMMPMAAPATIKPGQVPPSWTPAQAAEVTRLRGIDADNMDADSQARMAALPVTDREKKFKQRTN